MGIVKFVGNIESLVDNSLFGFGKWNTQPVKLRIKDDAVPVACYTAHKVPIKLMQPVKEALTTTIQAEGIIEPVTTPTDWSSGMVPVAKPGKSKVRICVDYRKLNLSLKREVYYIPTFEELTHKLSGVKCTSKLDAASGFFQIPLEESRVYTTFLTPFDRYRFKRLPMGINVAPEIYQRKMFELLAGIDGVLVYMDDVVVYGRSIAEHDNTLS